MSLPNKSLKEIAQSQKKRHRLLFAVMFFMMGSLIFSFVFGEMGFFNFSKMRHILEQARQEAHLLEIKNADILREIEGFRTDPFYVEAIARQRLGLVKKGEIVYEFYGEPAPDGNSRLVLPLEKKG
jgi:cell division protein FtsB